MSDLLDAAMAFGLEDSRLATTTELPTADSALDATSTAETAINTADVDAADTCVDLSTLRSLGWEPALHGHTIAADPEDRPSEPTQADGTTDNVAAGYDPDLTCNVSLVEPTGCGDSHLQLPVASGQPSSPTITSTGLPSPETPSPHPVIPEPPLQNLPRANATGSSRTSSSFIDGVNRRWNAMMDEPSPPSQWTQSRKVSATAGEGSLQLSDPAVMLHSNTTPPLSPQPPSGRPIVANTTTTTTTTTISSPPRRSITFSDTVMYRCISVASLDSSESLPPGPGLRPAASAPMLSLSRPVCPAPRATRLNRHSYQQQKNQRSASRPIGPAHPRLSSSSSPSDSPCSSDCTTDDEMGDSDDGGGVASDSSGDSSDGDDDDDDASFCSDDSDPSNLWPARQLPATASYVAAAQHSPILLRPAAVLRLPRPVAVPSAPRPPLAAWAPPTRAPRQLRLAEHSTPSSPPPVAAAPHTSSVLTSNPTSSPPTLRSTVVSAGTPLITPRSVPNPASPLPPPHSSSSPPAPSAASAASLRRRGLRHPAGFPGATATATTSPPTAVPSTALGLVAASPPRGGHGGGGATASSSDDDPPTASHFESPRSPMLVPTLPYSRPGDVVTAPAPVVAAAEASPDPSGIAAAEPATSNPPASPVQLAQLPQPAAITDLSDLPQPPSANDCTGIHRAAAVDDSASPGSVGDGLPASPATTSAASPPPLPTTATADYTDATSCTGAATRVELDSTPHAHTPAPADALADTTPVPPPSTRPRRRRAASADEAAAKTAAAVARVALAAELAAATTASRRAAPAEGPGAAYDPTAGPLGVAVPAQRADSGVDVATAAAAAAAATAAAAAVTSPALSQLPGDVEQLVTAPSPANGADYAEPVVPCAKLQTPPHPLPAAAATDKEHATTLGPLSPSLVFTTHEHALPPNLPHSAIGVPDTTLPPPPPPPLSTVSGGGSGAKSDDGPAFEAPLALPLSSAITDDPAAQPLAQSPLACPTGPTPFLLPPPPPAHSSPAAPAAPPNWQDKLLRLLALPARLGARLRLFMWRSSAARVAPAAAAADADADAAAALEEDGGGGIVSSGGSRRLWPAARRVAALRGRLLLGRARPRGVAPWEEHGATVGVGAAA